MSDVAGSPDGSGDADRAGPADRAGAARPPGGAGSGCCGVDHGCVFAKALLARVASCELADRHSQGEAVALHCRSPVARINCGTLAALLHERARFALRLPPPGRPMIHQHAIRLQCGGLVALREQLGDGEVDVHRLVGRVHERHGSLTDLPWQALVLSVVAWQPLRRRARR